ncbi:MAG: ferrous iron transport protein A [Desulfobulbus sp.]|nr:MAG: ferrous iron transport protein A [Desulfobulbus sp.]
MTKNPPKFSCPCAVSEHGKPETTGRALPGNATPLSLACGRERLKVCRINGDRKLCARMAQLGVLPGSEIEMICPGRSKQCMVRVMGSTVTLDPLCAEHILVTPL